MRNAICPNWSVNWTVKNKKLALSQTVGQFVGWLIVRSVIELIGWSINQLVAGASIPIYRW